MKTTRIPFNIISEKSESILFTENIPDFFKDFEMPGADHTIAFGSFGHLSIQEFHHTDSSINIRYLNALTMQDDHFIFQCWEPDLRLQFALNNDISFDEEETQIGEIPEGSFNIIFDPFTSAKQRMRAKRLYSSLSIHFTQSYLGNWCGYYPVLEHFISKIQNEQSSVLCDANQVTSIQMEEIIRQIIGNKYEGVTKSMYIDIKIKELFMLVMDKVSNYPTPCNTKLSKSEIEQFYEAKDALLNNIQNPMSLKQMSRKFGLNTKKIKTGFKQLYETTPFNLLLATRMEKAKAMLTCSNMDIASIADEIGYDNKHSFSKAFKKYFGYPPGKCRRNTEEVSFKYSHN